MKRSDKNLKQNDRNLNPSDRNLNPSDRNLNPSDRNLNPSDRNLNRNLVLGLQKAIRSPLPNSPKRTCRNLLALLLAFSLFTVMLCACEKDKTAGGTLPDPAADGSEGTRGRYVEQTIALPPELADCSVADMYASENTLHLLVMKNQDGRICLQEWICQDGVFTETAGDWLAGLALPDTDWLEAKLIQGADGTRYLYAGYAQENESGYAFTGHLWKATTDGAVEITPEKWSVPNEEWGTYETIQALAALDNNTLATLSYHSIDILSAQDGTVLESQPVATIYEGNIATDGTNLYLCSSDGVNSQIEKRKEGKDEDTLTIPSPADSSNGTVFSFGSGGSLFVDALRDGSLIAAGEEGIFRLPGNAPEGEWKQLAAGIDTDFSTPDCWCQNLSALENGGIYALFSTDGGTQKLNYYQYDPDAVSEVTQILKLYTVYENSLLKQAAAMYHKLHPEVIIDIESEYPLYSCDAPDYDTIYKKLNTRLMGSDTPDILVLDHLDMDSYTKMGLLEDLEDLIKPLEESGELLPNITGAYRSADGRRYAVPLQFDFTLALGRDIAPENMRSLEALADFLSRTDYSYLGEQTAADLVDLFYPYFCDKIVRDKQLDREALGKYLEYLKIIADNCGIVDKRAEDGSMGGMWDLTAKAKFALESAGSFVNCMTSMSMVDYVKGDFTAFENSFTPSLMTGVCAKSRYLDTARDFLQFALSRQVQDVEYSRGFPVNGHSLKEQSQKDRSNLLFFTTIKGENGIDLSFEGKPYSEETAGRLVALCESLDTPTKEDAKIREALTECLEKYLKGVQSQEDTITKIESGLKMYLAE